MVKSLQNGNIHISVNFYNGVCPVAEGGNTKKGVMLTTGGLIGNKASSNTGENGG